MDTPTRPHISHIKTALAQTNISHTGLHPLTTPETILDAHTIFATNTHIIKIVTPTPSTTNTAQHEINIATHIHNLHPQLLTSQPAHPHAIPTSIGDISLWHRIKGHHTHPQTYTTTHTTQLCNTITHLHAIPPPPTLPPLTVTDKPIRRLTENMFPTPEKYANTIRDLHHRIRDPFDSMLKQNRHLWVLNHADLHTRNYLWKNDTTPVLLDWESAAHTIPEWDFATIYADVALFNNNPQATKTILHHTALDKEKLQLCVAMVALLSASWRFRTPQTYREGEQRLTIAHTHISSLKNL